MDYHKPFLMRPIDESLRIEKKRNERLRKKKNDERIKEKEGNGREET